MSKEEIERIKNELREELREELNNAIESQKSSHVWTKYTKEYVMPILDKKYDSNKIKYKLRDALNTIARVYNNKPQTCKITEKELEDTKPIINVILREMGLI